MFGIQKDNKTSGSALSFSTLKQNLLLIKSNIIMKNLNEYNTTEINNCELQKIDGGLVFMTAFLVAALIGTAAVTAKCAYERYK